MNTPRIFLSLALTATLAQAQDNVKPPATTAPVQKETLTWIATTDASWQAAYKRDITDVHDAGIGNLKKQYQASLETAMARASSADDLKGALALRDEQKRFAETNVFPEQDEAAEAATVKQVRAAARLQMAQLEKETAVRAKALLAKYDQALAQAQTQLTQRQRLDDAVLIQNKREEVAAVWITPAMAAAEKASPATTAPVIAKTTATPTAMVARSYPGIGAATPETKSAFDAQLVKLTRTAWTWETPTGKNTIKFAKDGTCVHTRFNGTFEIQKDDTVVVTEPQRKQVLVFNFDKGEYNGYDSVLKQKITGKRTYQK